MAGFLFYVALVVGLGGSINAENAGKTQLYADEPTVLVADVADAVTDAYAAGEPITQDIYAQRFND